MANIKGRLAVCGTSTLARSSTARNHNWVVSTSSRQTRSISFVQPLGPGGTPEGAPDNLGIQIEWGCGLELHHFKWDLLDLGLRALSTQLGQCLGIFLEQVKLLSTLDELEKLSLADLCLFCAATPRRFCSSSIRATNSFLPGLNANDAFTKSTHLPASKSSARWASSSLPRVPTPRGLWRSIGTEQNNFDARTSPTTSPIRFARTLSRRATAQHCRNRHRMNLRHVFNMVILLNMHSVKSTSYICAHRVDTLLRLAGAS